MPSLPSTADIVIAGGGPAGATIARLLAGLGFHVVVYEKRAFPRHQIGESLTPQVLPLLDFLGVRTRIESAGFLHMVGHTVCWGNAQPRTSYYSPDHSRQGLQVWRAAFDALLLDHARAGGVTVYERQLVKDVRFHDAGATVHTTHGHTDACFFIDATGRSGVLARRELRQRDPVFQTLAVSGYWQNAAGPPGGDFANTILETYADGLAWSVPLHNGFRNVTFLVDWQLGTHIRRSGLSAFYRDQVARTPYVGEFLRPAHLVLGPQAFDATWHTATTFAGERFLLVGDAGMFVDPLSSEGVHKAMASAITGAAVVNTILRRPAITAHALQFYDESQRSTYELHYQQSAQYYREEQRWPDAPFWQRRATNDEPRVPSPESRTTSHEPRTMIVSHIALAPETTIALRPAIEGPFVELREAMVTPRYPRGLRFLERVCLPPLLRAVQEHGAVEHIMQAYLHTPEGRGCPPEAVRQVLARLYQEEALTATAPSENQSS